MILNRFGFLFLLLFMGAQLSGQTLVFKVRAPATECTIITQESYLWLETDNPVQVKVRGAKNVKIKVVLTGGKIVKQIDDMYYMNFTKSGTAAISVYQDTPKGRELLTTKKIDVKSPDVYFCGIKLDSVSKYIRLKNSGMHAYSRFYKQKMDITSFEMYYIEDTTNRRSEPLRLKSDSSMISNEMRKIIMKFQPKRSSIYMMNIICRVPNGTKRILDPIQLNVDVDTANKDNLTLIYYVRRKVL